MPKAPKKLYTSDLETDPFIHGRYPAPFWGGVFDGKEHVDFWGGPEVCAKLVDHFLKLEKAVIYFHNGGKFDFHFLLPHLPDDISIFVIGNRIVSIKLPNSVELRDSYSILPVPLGKMGEKFEIDYELFELEKREAHKKEIIKYARQDNVALYNSVSAFLTTYGDSLTLATTAFKELQKIGIKPPRGYKEQDENLRRFYYGGRCQCFEYGTFTGDFKYIDINSAYPTAMTFPHCFEQSFFKAKKPAKNELRFKQSFFTVECYSRGALPVRTKTGISFPNCRGTFHITGWELFSALKTKMIDKVKILECWQPNSVMSFKPFVDKFFALKLQAELDGDANGRLFAKLILNSCYGKFAMNPDKFKDYKLAPLGELIEGGEHIMDLDIAGFSVFAFPIESDKKNKAYKNVATAASITGYVRAFLWESLCAVERPLYCDTDSIMCENYGDLQLGNQLGEWALEAEPVEITIAGKKLYAAKLKNGKYKLASKGVKATPDQIKAAAEGAIFQWNNDAPSYSIISDPKFLKRNVKKTIDENSPNPFNPF